MANITLSERGRALVVDVAGEFEYEFAPVTTDQGLTLALNVLGTIASYAATDIGVDTESAVSQALDITLGEHRDEIMQLRDEEATAIFNAVMLWQVKGGSFELAQLSLADRPKALNRWTAEISPLLLMNSGNGEPGKTNADAGTTQKNSSKQSKPAKKQSPKKPASTGSNGSKAR